MTEGMPPGRGFGAGSGDAAIMRGWWEHQHRAHWRAAVSASMMFRTPPPPPYYRDLLSLASALIAGGRYELAVIVAQMACEVVVEQTLTPLLKGKKVKNFNLEGGQGATLKTYTQLTHDRITTKQFWKPFDRHAKLRHKIVHFGARVGHAEAQESLTVATQLVDHVEKVREGLR